jgi:glutaconate CoA-transferase subunit B
MSEQPKLPWTPTEMMTVVAARALRNSDVCFVGIGAPSAACNLARLTHAPDITLIYESGTIATRPNVLPLSIGDGELCETALATVSVPEMFRYWLQGGRVTVGFLGGAQVDRFANLNTTVVGPYDKPKVRCPAAAAHRRSPPPATRCSSPWRRAGARSSPGSTSSPRSATARERAAASAWA